MEEVLKALACHMKALGLEYELETYTGTKNPYWIGEYYGSQNADESGYLDHFPILSGFALDARKELYGQANAIRKYFYSGSLLKVGNTAIATWLQSIVTIPYEQEGLTKIQITLHVQTWEGEHYDRNR